MFRSMLLLVSIFGLVLSSSLLARAATDAPGEVSSTPGSPIGSDSQGYEFAVPPATDADLVFRVNRETGEVVACVFSPKGPTIGSTVCFPAGEGAGKQPSGDYGLIASNLATAKGLFRVNRQTGEVSVCYVLNERVVCTAPIR
jgi:hypothetical protein